MYVLYAYMHVHVCYVCDSVCTYVACVHVLMCTVYCVYLCKHVSISKDIEKSKIAVILEVVLFYCKVPSYISKNFKGEILCLIPNTFFQLWLHHCREF